MTNPTPQSPVLCPFSQPHPQNPLGLSIDARGLLCEVFATAAHAHKREYIDRKRALKYHLAKENPDQKHTAVIISSCEFSERYLNDLAKTYKDVMGSDFWIKEVEKIIQQAETI